MPFNDHTTARDRLRPRRSRSGGNYRHHAAIALLLTCLAFILLTV